MVDGDDTGLRERKKVATRNALCRAAIHLALQEGPENVPDSIGSKPSSPSVCEQLGPRPTALEEAGRPVEVRHQDRGRTDGSLGPQLRGGRAHS